MPKEKVMPPAPPLFSPGDRVRGAITGKYLGVVERSFRNYITIRYPSGELVELPEVMIQKIPDRVDEGTNMMRVWTS